MTGLPGARVVCGREEPGIMYTSAGCSGCERRLFWMRAPAVLASERRLF